MTTVLVNLQGHGDDVDLLDDDGWFVVGHEQVPSAAGAGVQEVVRGDRGEHLWLEQLALVCGMSRLAAALASLLAGRRLRLARLDDVRGGGLGRVRGILAGRGELFLQLLDCVLKSGELSAQGVDFGLQPLAIGTRASYRFSCRRVYTPVPVIQHCERY